MSYWLIVFGSWIVLLWMQYLATTGPIGGLGLENGRNFHLRWLLQFSKYGVPGCLKIQLIDNNPGSSLWDLTKRVVTGGTFWCVCLAHDFLYLKTLSLPTRTSTWPACWHQAVTQSPPTVDSTRNEHVTRVGPIKTMKGKRSLKLGIKFFFWGLCGFLLPVSKFSGRGCPWFFQDT